MFKFNFIFCFSLIDNFETQKGEINASCTASSAYAHFKTTEKSYGYLFHNSTFKPSCSDPKWMFVDFCSMIKLLLSLKIVTPE